MLARISASPQAVTHHVTTTAARSRRAACGAVQVVVASSATATRFTVTKRVQYGQHLRVVGSVPELGNWDVARAPALRWSDGNVWSAEVVLPAGCDATFKFVVCADGHAAEWEQGDNRQLGGASGAVSAVFGRTGGGQAAANAASAGSHGRDSAAPVNAADDDDDLGTGPSSAFDASPSDSLVLALAGDGKWRGQEVTFMRSNAHTGERRGSWKPENVDGAAKALVEGDMRAASWLQKLEVVAGLVGADRSQALDDLACSAVYLQWVSTGVVPCVEGGGHQRPNKASAVGRGIFIGMERALGDTYGSPGVAELPRLAVRAILPWLPSFSGAFTQSVPLTRIRDIAHRNDIPSDLKQEIKHTIQNKLHRNAGPEDLVATEAMLQRITAVPGQYNAAFVAEFKVFHAELKDFFNARTAFERLHDLQSGLDDAGKVAVAQLVAAKQAMDEGTSQQGLAEWLKRHGKELNVTAGERTRELQLATLHAATGVRALLVSLLSSGLRNDAPDSALVARQAVRTAELALEEYAFVLASNVCSSLEADAADGRTTNWSPPLMACILLLRHLGLSGFRPSECIAAEAGVATAREDPHLLTGSARTKDNPAAMKEAVLAARAAVQRTQRLAEAHSQALMGCFAERAVTLGRGLGVSDAQARIHGEASVRAAVSFPLSNQAGWLLRATDRTLGGDGTETLVSGDITALLVALPRLTPDAIAACMRSTNAQPGSRLVVLLDAADGEEDVSALGADIGGVILKQQLPHLSHLAVRARQQHTVLVTCAPDANLAKAAKASAGKLVRLHARPEGGATLHDAVAGEDAKGGASPKTTAKRSSGKASAAPVTRVNTCTLVPLAEAQPNACGAKAATCGALLRLAQRISASSPAAAFTAPDGCVLPFGCMEAALRDGGVWGRYTQLCSQLDSAAADGKASSSLETICESLRILLSAARPPAQVLDKVQHRFPRGTRLCVRSSANVEDLEGMSGAGLYSSLAGVPAGDTTAVGAAIAGVWASLHTSRAVRARAAAGVRQADAAMAVLLQEQAPSQFAFVLHTRSTAGHPDAVLAELCVGHGETLASGARGSGWRLEAAPSGAVATLSFANFSSALQPQRDGAPGMAEVPVDYSRQPLTRDSQARLQLGARLGAVGRALQTELGGVPQDVEGAIVGDTVVVVQSRPQPL